MDSATPALRDKPDGRRARGDRTRELVLDSAMQIASSEGLEHLTIGRVATAAGVPKSTVQVLYRTRETLQLAALEAGVRRFAEALSSRLPKGGDGRSRLSALVAAWFEIVSSQVLPGGCLVTATAAELKNRPGVILDAAMSHRSRWTATLLEAVRLGREDGSLASEVDPDQLVFEITALLSIANVSTCMPETGDFARARATALRLIEAARHRPTAL